jgi:hypothetical protein
MLGVMRQVPTVDIAVNLTADCRRRPPELPRDSTDRDVDRDQVSDHDPFLLR